LLATRATIKILVDAVEIEPLVGSFISVASATEIDIIGLALWDAVRVEFITTVSAGVNFLRMSTNNGSTFASTGYNSGLHDGGGTESSTTGCDYSRASGDQGGQMLITNMASATSRTTFSSSCITSSNNRANHGSAMAPAGTTNAIRIDGGSYTNSTVRVYGLRLA
jgi:hypothetical protein